MYVMYDIDQRSRLSENTDTERQIGYGTGPSRTRYEVDESRGQVHSLGASCLATLIRPNSNRK